MPCYKTPEKNRYKIEPNKNGYPNSPNIEVIIEHDIYGHTLLLLPQEDVPNGIIHFTFLIIPQEYVQKF